jgi:beta-1,2-mannobiose phosphorylase / 1,2-beta-oligomannan phosphorylase
LDTRFFGFVPDVVFPTGIVETGASYLIYYGAVNSCTAVVEFSKDEVLGSLE